MPWTGQNPQGRSGDKLRSGIRLLIAVVTTLTGSHSFGSVYDVLVDDCRHGLTEAPSNPWYFNATGGDRGCLGVADSDLFAAPRSGSYGVECRTAIGFGPGIVGFWYGLNRPAALHRTINPKAIFHPLIKPAYQGRVLGVAITVTGFASPSGRDDLALVVQLKGWDSSGAEIEKLAHVVAKRAALLATTYPRVFWVPLPADFAEPFGIASVFLQNASPGDTLELGPTHLRVETRTLDPLLEPFLFGYANLLNAYSETTGLVQDRANYADGRVENITATGKLAKLIAAAIDLGITDGNSGAAAIDQIAETILLRLPRGPAGLGPHFTQDGGAAILPETEWASGDTAYCLLDLMVALGMTGDPGVRLGLCQARLAAIDWNSLLRPDGGFSHGFRQDGTPLEGTWLGFGMEVIGVNLASLAGGGPLGTMLPSPTDNGSGFIVHAGYPVAPLETDRWGNDWAAIREIEAVDQLSWYQDPAHANSAFSARGWFGLSAAERPEGWHRDPSAVYVAYGIGGRFTPAIDGNHDVVTPHYSGMIAALAPEASLAMWNSLRALGLASPMHLAESIAISPVSGEITQVNFMKSSWNLALFTEGWAFAHPNVSALMKRAMLSIPSLASAWATLFPEGSRPGVAATPDRGTVEGLRDRVAMTESPVPRRSSDDLTGPRAQFAVLPSRLRTRPSASRA